MTIEISAPAPNTGTKPAARAQNTQTAGGAPAVSFLSMLSAMGLGAADATELATALPEAGLADAQYLTGGTVGAQSGPNEDASQATLAQMPLAADWWAAAAPAAVAGPSGQTRGAAQGTGAGHGAASTRVGAMEAGHPSASEVAWSKPAAGLNATDELQQLPARTLTAQQDGDARPVSSRDFMARVEAARLAAEPDAGTLRAASAPAAAAPSLGQGVSMFDAASAALRAGGASRSQERNQPRLAGAGAAQGLVTWGDATPAGTQHGASSVYAPGALTPAPATAMAEKVHYWVSRGIQSASLQLDAFAGGSVDVSIAVKGDEAIVEFRTDQPQARQLLLEAMPQLKELLANEGLMLSGGFVGDSAQQDGQSKGRGNLQASAVSEALVGTPQADQSLTGALDGASGRRVDLFV